MTHKEHVKKALEEAIPFVDSRGYGGVAHIMHDALELLKEQEEKIQQLRLALQMWRSLFSGL